MTPETATKTVRIEPVDATRIAAAVHSAGLAASTDNARYNLENLWVKCDSNGWTFVATDSYMIVRVDVENMVSANTTAHQTLVDAKWFITATKPFLKKHNPGFTMMFDIERSTVTIQTDAGDAMQTSTPDCTYPDWQSLFNFKYQANQQHQRTGYNPDFMARLMKSATTIGGDQPMIIEQLDPLKPGLFTRTNNNTNWSAVLMPVRTSQ
jgi:DNA polymerase III sliding clamp (beta) subunit (PCNA family)